MIIADGGMPFGVSAAATWTVVSCVVDCSKAAVDGVADVGCKADGVADDSCK